MTKVYLQQQFITSVLWLWAADGDITEKPVEPVKVYSEKELIREFEKIASTLVPDKDWSIRIAAMQRFEGLVIGGLLISQRTGYIFLPRHSWPYHNAYMREQPDDVLKRELCIWVIEACSSLYD